MTQETKPLADNSLSDVLDAVLATVRKVSSPRPVPAGDETFDADIFESGIVDSLGWIRLLDELEDIYGVELDIEALDEKGVTSMRDIAAYLVEIGS
jgi:acyl carrier protein